MKKLGEGGWAFFMYDNMSQPKRTADLVLTCGFHIEVEMELNIT